MMEERKIKIELEDPMNCCLENTESDDDDEEEEEEEEEYGKLAIPFLLPKAKPKSFKSWDFKRKLKGSDRFKDAEEAKNQDKILTTGVNDGSRKIVLTSSKVTERTVQFQHKNISGNRTFIEVDTIGYVANEEKSVIQDQILTNRVNDSSSKIQSDRSKDTEEAKNQDLILTTGVNDGSRKIVLTSSKVTESTVQFQHKNISGNRTFIEVNTKGYVANEEKSVIQDQILTNRVNDSSSKIQSDRSKDAEEAKNQDQILTTGVNDGSKKIVLTSGKVANSTVQFQHKNISGNRTFIEVNTKGHIAKEEKSVIQVDCEDRKKDIEIIEIKEKEEITEIKKDDVSVIDKTLDISQVKGRDSLQKPVSSNSKGDERDNSTKHSGRLIKTVQML